MKKNVKSTAALKTAAKNEVKVINNNPTYIMRTLNKLAKGSDKEAKAVEGYSIKAVKELYNRVNDAFGEGFWWNSVYAIGGRLMTSIKAIDDKTAFYLDPTFPIDDNKVVIRFAGDYYLGTFAAKWDHAAVVAAAAAKLQLVEGYSKAIDKAEKADKADKEAKEAKELAKTIADLKAAVAAGTMTEAEAAAKLFAA